MGVRGNRLSRTKGHSQSDGSARHDGNAEKYKEIWKMIDPSIPALPTVPAQ